MKQIGRTTTIILILGVILSIYGYLCRAIGLYFFWESKSIGWGFIIIGGFCILIDRLKIKKAAKQKYLINQIFIGLVGFVMLIQTLLLIVIPCSDAFTAAKTFLKNDANIKHQVGEVTGFGLIPKGGIQKSTDSLGEYGYAAIALTVKGDKKYKDLIIYVVKQPDTTAWVVDGME